VVVACDRVTEAFGTEEGWARGRPGVRVAVGVGGAGEAGVERIPLTNK